MEAAVPVPDEGGRRTAEGEGKEGLSLDLGCHHPHKLIRSDSCPFRAMSRSPATDHAAERAAPSGGAGPPLSSHTLVGGRGWTAVFSHSDSSDAYGTPMALLQPLVTSFNPRGLGSGDATLQLCSPFTAAQWQELHRQALIFKYMMASTPLPLELLFSPRPLVDGHSLVSNLGRGGDYLNLRVTGTNGDPEPGRCRRTDGKKWRCSRGVVPGQKYCERHVHRARPRSRKPVELDRTAGAPAAVANGVYSTISASVNHATSATTTSPSSAAARHCTHSPPGVVPRGPDLKFPFHFMVPQDKKLRYAGSGGGDAEAQATTHQWQLLRAKMGLTNTTSALWQQHQDVQLNLNDHHACPFPSTHISSLRHPAEPSDQRDIPRWFIDAWSREHPFHGPATNICDNKDNSETTDKSGCRDLSPSNLTLSMSGTCGSDSDDHDQFPQAQFQMGLRLADAGKMLAPSWMSPVSAIGGPLAEVLQASSTVSFGKEHPGHHSDVTRGTAAGLIDLMSKTSYDSESTSPRESETRGFSSPTRVLHKALASLSDSSSNSSATFGPGPWPELGLQWGSPSTSRRTD